MRRVIICVTNDLETDQRVHKVAITLMNQGWDVLLVGRLLKYSNPINRKYRTKRFKLPINSGILFYLIFNIRLFLYLLTKKHKIVLSNDLDTLPACRCATIIKNTKIVYDSHELFTEVPELLNHKFKQQFWKLIERIFIKNIKHSYTVCNSIAEYYNSKYKINMKVIRNVPYFENKNEDTLKYDTFTLIYQGAVNKDRGIELMIDVMQHLPNYNLIICGFGDEYYKIKSKTKLLELKNVIFKGRLSWEELKNITCRTHIGLSWEEKSGLSYQYALPNKLFDYINARIPVLVSDLIEMQKIVTKYKIGDIIKSREISDIIKQINDIKIKYENNYFIDKLEFASKDLNWEKEQNKLINIFN